MKEIPGFSDYCITKDGKIWSRINNKWLKPSINGRGYLLIQLFKNKKAYNKHIHRLLLEAYVGKCPKNMECRHLDGNKLNNNLSNLKWGTRSENRQDAVRHGTANVCKIGENHPAAKLSEQNAMTIYWYYKTGMYTQKELASKFNTTRETVSAILNKRNWKHIEA